jgi:NADP-dependent 3-hydroxy acid dehydrogenase YdfG
MTNGKIYITGASDGLGLALGQMLIEAGYSVASLSRSKPTDARLNHIAMDLTDEASIERAVSEIIAGGGIKALICAAGASSPSDHDGQYRRGEIAKVFQANVEGHIALTMLLMDKIIADSSDVVMVSSTLTTKPSTDTPIYIAAKWAVHGWAKYLSTRFRGTNARATEIIMGGFVSGLHQKVGAEPIIDEDRWMPVADAARAIYDVLMLPRTMEISEIVVNRKTGSR